MELRAILDRIDSVARPRNISDQKLSLMAGRSRDLMRAMRRRIMRGEEDAGINPRNLRAIADALGVSPEWLETGRGDPASGVIRRPPEGGGETWRRIRCFDIDAAAGDGCEVGIEEAMFDIGFSPAMLADITAAPPDKLAFVRVRGDSMMPTLLNGDWILVDTTRRTVALGGLFLLRSDGMLMVKRVEPTGDPARLRIVSDNPVVHPFEAPAESIEVMGRVVWIGRRV